jgi:hypothetical protein
VVRSAGPLGEHARLDDAADAEEVIADLEGTDDLAVDAVTS